MTATGTGVAAGAGIAIAAGGETRSPLGAGVEHNDLRWGTVLFPVRQRLRARARELAVEWRDINGLVPYASNARTHSEAQIAQIAGSIREFGFTNPVLIDPEGGIFGQFTSLPASMIRPPSPTR